LRGKGSSNSSKGPREKRSFPEKENWKTFQEKSTRKKGGNSGPSNEVLRPKKLKKQELRRNSLPGAIGGAHPSQKGTRFVGQAPHDTNKRIVERRVLKEEGG